jgi:hypothetical protein
MRIRRGLSSRRLSCGCVAGVYETYRDEIVTIVDAHGQYCVDPAHNAGNILPTVTNRASDSDQRESPRR